MGLFPCLRPVPRGRRALRALPPAATAQHPVRPQGTLQEQCPCQHAPSAVVPFPVLAQRCRGISAFGA